MAEANLRLAKIDQRALIINSENRVLLVREEDQDGWDLPGGLMLDSNNWRESLEFLIADLLDMQVVANNPVYAGDYVNPDTGEYIYVSFVQADVFNDQKYKTERFAEIGWFDIKDIGAIPFSTYDAKDAIRIYFELNLRP